MFLVLGTALLYRPAISNGFVNFDDPDYVTRNLAVQQGLSWHNIVWAFGTENPAANWHPLTWISHMLDVQWFGANPAGHHFTNILFFALDVLLLFLFLHQVTENILRSAAVAALFAVHPLNVETAAWIAERKSVLSIFFMLLAMLAYVWYTQRPSGRRYLLVAVLFALALMAKVMVITLPFALLLVDYWPLHRYANSELKSWKRFRTLLVEKIPLFALSLAAGWMTVHVHHKEGALSRTLPLVWRVKNAIFSCAAYLAKIFWPTKLAVFYPHPENSLGWGKVFVALAFLMVISVAALRFRKKEFVMVGWLWYLGMLFPMIGLIQSGRQGMADRYACLSLIGILIAVVWLVADCSAALRLHPGLPVIFFVVTLVPCFYLTRMQIGFWQNSYSLFAHTLEVTRDNGLAENNLGMALMEMGRVPAAQQHLEAAVRLIPEFATAHYNLGIALQTQNQLQQAAKQYHLAIATSSDRMEAAQAHNNLGTLFLQSQDRVAAKSEFSAALALNPSEVHSYLGRGMIEQQQWDYNAAAEDFAHAAAIAPSSLAFFLLGRALEDKGQRLEAKLAYERALQLAPGMPEARDRLTALQQVSSK